MAEIQGTRKTASPLDNCSRIRSLPLRQVHLDFHTSELIPNVGTRFDAREFQAALQVGRVNSVTLFAKCHHSWSYYPTKVGQPHPHLTRDLLGEQIAACREIGVRCPIYYTVGWSATDAREHPEWCARNRDGSISTFRFDLSAGPDEPLPGTAWINLCPSGGYRQLMLDQTREIMERWDPVDGLFYDICNTRLCWCAECRSGMAAEGLDPESDADAYTYSVHKWDRFFQGIREVILSRNPDASIFLNGITHPTTPVRLLYAETHFELEDLPTAWGGYDKLPPRARFFDAVDRNRPRIAMTGKFHTQWGEFGGYKHPDALRYEAASMLAYGCGCSVGDQLHPSGEMDRDTYRLIGAAYEYVEQIEEYGVPSEPCARLAVWPSRSAAAVSSGALSAAVAAAPWANAPTLAHDEGTFQALLERQRDFAVIDPASVDETVLRRYDAVVLTGGRCLDRQQAGLLRRFVEGGGALLVQYEALLDRDTSEPLADLAELAGARWEGNARYDLDYIRVPSGSALSAAGADREPPVTAPVLCYTAAARLQPQDGETLAHLREPYFDRRYGHYCSHQNTPYRTEDADHPAVLRRGRVVTLAHPLGAIYHAHGARIHRDLLVGALDLVYRSPAVEVTLPSAGRVTLLHQPERSRYVAHLLYAPPLPRGRCLVIEDLPVLRDLELRVRVPEAIQAAVLPLEQTELPCSTDRDGALQVIVPRTCGHQVVVFQY